MAHKRKAVPGYVRYPIAGLSGMGATVFVHPLDLVKFRMQLSGEGGAVADHRSWVHAVENVVKQEGFAGLYAGLSANLFHQSLYTTTRLGTYQMLLDRMRKTDLDRLPYQVLAAMVGAFCASFLSTPGEVRRSNMSP